MEDGKCKARMTIQDLKKLGASGDCTHCPTPSAVSNRIVECKACANGCAIIKADVISDFPHTKLQADQ
eukprot:15063568-Alexandrium_andersonii.AAC.1